MVEIALIVAAVAAVRGLWSPCGLSMVSALNPVSERSRGNRPAVTAAWYVFGSLSGGAVLGLFCAVAALGLRPLDLSDGAVFGAGAVVACVCALSDLRVGPVLPDHPRQVNETWLVRYRRWIYAFGFGAQIGTGFATYIMTAAVYLTAVLAILSGPLGALAVGLTFGLVRGLCVLVSARAGTPDRLRALLRRIDLLAVPSLAVAVAVELAAAVVLAFAAAGPYIAGAVGIALLIVALTPVALGRALVRR